MRAAIGPSARLLAWLSRRVNCKAGYVNSGCSIVDEHLSEQLGVSTSTISRWRCALVYRHRIEADRIGRCGFQCRIPREGR